MEFFTAARQNLPVVRHSPLEVLMHEHSSAGARAERWNLGFHPLAGLAVVCLLAAITAASAGNPVSLPLRPGHAQRFDLIVRVVVLAVLVTSAVLVSTSALRRIGNKSGRNVAPGPIWILHALTVSAALTALLSLAMIARIELLLETEHERRRYSLSESGVDRGSAMGLSDARRAMVIAGEGLDAEDDGTAPTPLQPSRRARVPYAAFVFVLSAALLLLFLLARARARHSRRHALASDESAADQETVRDAVLATIYAMQQDPDPATAIIGAYARLLQNLEDCGLGRLRHEGPKEHLRRVLTSVRVRREPLHRLIELFELARFSTHRVTTPQRDEAVAALGEVARDIAAAAASAATAHTSAVDAHA